MEFKMIVVLLAVLVCSSSHAQDQPMSRAYELQFGKGDGSGTSNRSAAEIKAIEKGRLKVVDALRDQTLQTAYLQYTDEGDLFICFESMHRGFGQAMRRAQKTKELYEDLLKLKPDSSKEVESCFDPE